METLKESTSIIGFDFVGKFWNLAPEELAESLLKRHENFDLTMKGHFSLKGSTFFLMKDCPDIEHRSKFQESFRSYVFKLGGGMRASI